MKNLRRVSSQVSLRPEWKENLCLLFVVSMIVAASVILFLPEASQVGGTNTIDIHQVSAAVGSAIASRSVR
jgi:hypothetical protein